MEIVQTNKAPQAIGPYSQALKAGGFVFVSGNIPLKADGSLVTGSVEDQTHQVFSNIKAVLEEAGIGLDKVVKTTVFLKDIDQFGAVNEVYAEYFSSHKPARSTVEAARLPRDVDIEIDVIAIL